MIITSVVGKYVVLGDASLREALTKASEHKIRTLFVVDGHDRLLGTLSSGDVSSWLIRQDIADLRQQVMDVCNRRFVSAKHGEPATAISKLFTDRIDAIPLLDQEGHLISIALNKPKAIQIGDFSLHESSPTFVIAEIGINHNGSLSLAKELIDMAVWAGADCAKFQLRDLENLYRNKGNPNDASEDLGSQYVLDLLARFSLSVDNMYEVFDYCKDKEILPLCTPWDSNSLDNLEAYRMSAYKVASPDLTNHEFLVEIAKTGKPMLVSTGMSSESEVRETVRLLHNVGAQFVLLHCNSTYPTPYKDVNLAYLPRLQELGQCLVGYSGHERGFSVPIAAVARGAKVIEKHFTLDKNMEGNDHRVSLLPEEFREMVRSIRQVEEANGVSEDRFLTQGELMNRESLAKSLVAREDIKKGETITNKKLIIKSPGKGLQPMYKESLIGRAAKRDIKAGNFFYTSDVENSAYCPKSFRFDRPWGLPVRFHDYRLLTEKAKPNFVEFHLSYKDLEVNLDDYFVEQLDYGFAVHSPEVFQGDLILDLASSDDAHRTQSIVHLRRVIDLTRDLANFFPKTSKPFIITNIGGFSESKPLDKGERGQLYERIIDSLSKIDASGVEIIPQTMPPFPWYFGGQRHANLFVDAEETSIFCKQHGYRVCLDLSHSKLACNHYGWSLAHFIETVGDYIAHVHIVDAKGEDQEGLQIGDGEIDFGSVGEILRKCSPDSGFIPEIWQGHKNEGQGFWEALTKLEAVL